MSKNKFFIGFPSFEALLANAPSKTVYISKATITRSGPFSTHFVEHNVTACVVGENICHYWKMPFGSYQQMGDAPLTGSKDYPEKCRERCDSAEEILSEVARDYGFTVIKGLISFPNDVPVLEGTAHSLRYIKAENRFERKSAENKPEENQPEQIAA